MDLKINLHTVYMTVGPSFCGKSVFIRMLIQKVRNELKLHSPHKFNIQHLSTQSIREDLMGYSETDIREGARARAIAGDGAEEFIYDHFFHKLSTLLRYPIKAHIVFLDATGLSTEYRQKVIKVCNDNAYELIPLIFNYKTRAMYSQYPKTTSIPTSMIEKQVTTFKEKVLRELADESNKSYHDKIMIKQYYEEKDINVVIYNLDLYNRCIMDSECTYAVIGDVHESVETLVALIRKLGFLVDDEYHITSPYPKNRLLQIGDLFDKGGNTVEMLKFIASNIENPVISWVIGNHEYKIKRLLELESENKDIKNIKDIKDTQHDAHLGAYTAYNCIRENEEYRKIFNKYIAIALPFAYWQGGGSTKSWYATHAPCRQKYIGKLHPLCVARQGYFFVDRSTDASHNDGHDKHNPRYDRDNLTDIVAEENKSNFPYHIIGHVSLEEQIRLGVIYLSPSDCKTKTLYRTSISNNYIFIDTSHDLSAVIMSGSKLKYKSIKKESKCILESSIVSAVTTTIANETNVSSSSYKEVKRSGEVFDEQLITPPDSDAVLTPITETEAVEKSLSCSVPVDADASADSRAYVLNSRVKYLIDNKIQFVSGTISPADSDEKTGELESLEQGLRLMKTSLEKLRINVPIMMQIKEMGSRCQVYLNINDDRKSFAVSRKGRIITKIPYDTMKKYVYDPLRRRPQVKEYISKNNISLLITDGELLPWSAIGEDLIEREFRSIDTALGIEIKCLQESGFVEVLGKSIETMKSHPCYDAIKKSMAGDIKNASEVKKIFKSHPPTLIRNYKILARKNTLVDVDEMLKNWKEYHEQLKLFDTSTSTSGSKIEYKPWSILKYISNDGKEVVPILNGENIVDHYRILSDNPFEILDFSTDSLEELKRKSEAFWKTITIEQKLEGIVLKPIIHSCDNGEMIPFLKVRNPNYLRLIYGYDLSNPTKLKRLIRNKKISKKIQASKREHELALEMLKQPLSAYHYGNEQLINIFSAFVNEEELSKEDIDPRL